MAAFGHRVARVDRQIKNDLGNLARVGFDVGAFFLVMEMANHGNIFANEPEQRALEICDDRIYLGDHGFERLFSTEGEKLLS